MYIIPSFHGNPSHGVLREILRIFSGISHGAALAQAAALKFQLQQPVSRATKQKRLARKMEAKVEDSTEP